MPDANKAKPKGKDAKGKPGKKPKRVNSKRIPVDADFVTRTKDLKQAFDNEVRSAEVVFGRELDLQGYVQGTDPEYLGIMKGSYYGKPFGNDSSSIQAVLGGMSYWRRIQYRPEDSTGSSGYTKIKELMKEDVIKADRPHIELESKQERLNFFNTLKHKYSLNGEKPFGMDRMGHRSSPHEVAYMMSNFQRRDRDLVFTFRN